MNYRRMPIEAESPEQFGYAAIDCNLAESSVTDRALSDLPADLGRLVLGYGDHVGHRALRARIAAEGGEGLTADDVLLTVGAAGALFIAATSLLEPGDRIVVARPNYASNIESPRAVGAEVEFLEQRFEEGYAVDVHRLEALLTPRTRLVSLTSPHNPSGRVIREADLARVIALVEARGCRLLLDETYRELRDGPPAPLAAARSARAISVSSLSKTFGLPGIRLGWLVCRDRALAETFLAAKEQIFICNSVVDEEIAYQALLRREEWLPRVRAHVRANRAMVADWMRGEPRLEWVEPDGGVVCFPRIRAGVGIDLDRFYATLKGKYKTWVGPGHWFEEERRHFRIGFGWPGPDELSRGLANVSRALDEAATAPR